MRHLRFLFPKFWFTGLYDFSLPKNFNLAPPMDTRRFRVSYRVPNSNVHVYLRNLRLCRKFFIFQLIIFSTTSRTNTYTAAKMVSFLLIEFCFSTVAPVTGAVMYIRPSGPVKDRVWRCSSVDTPTLRKSLRNPLPGCC